MRWLLVLLLVAVGAWVGGFDLGLDAGGHIQLSSNRFIAAILFSVAILVAIHGKQGWLDR